MLAEKKNDFYGKLKAFLGNYKVSKINSETCFSSTGLFAQITHHELKARPDGGFNE